MDPLGLLSSYFHTFILYEPELEQSRIALAANVLFDPYTAFKQIDRTESGFVRADELYDFFHQYSLRVELRYIFALVKCYSTHSEGKIFIGDFFNIILPHTKLSLKEDAMNRQSNEFSPDLIQPLLRIFRFEFEMWEKIERIRFEFNSADFNTWKVFCSIDVPRSGFLTPSKIKRVLDRYGKVVEEYMVGVSIDRLDKDGDFMLSFEEFAWGLGVLAEKSEERAVKSKKKVESSDKSEKKPGCSLQGLFELILEVEKTLEKQKKKLLDCPDFNLPAIFNLLDPNDLGFSTESDFTEALSDLDIKASKEEISLIFKHFSNNNNKRLTHSQLEKLFLPYLETNIWSYQELQPETLNRLKQLLEKTLKSEAIYEKYRQILRQQKVNEKEAFAQLGKGQVGAYEIKMFILANGDTNDKEVSWILGYFKKSVYETFDFQAFSAEFLPKSRLRF